MTVIRASWTADIWSRSPRRVWALYSPGGTPWPESFSPDKEVDRFVEEEFGDVHLGDVRLNRRLRKTVANLARDPGWSIPHASGTWSATKGAYRLFSHAAVCRERVLEGHIQATVARVRQEPLVLVPADTTYLNYTHHPRTQGLGKIGNRNTQELKGVLVHSALAITAGTHRVLGLLDQQVLVREDYCPPDEDSRQMRKRSRESQKWLTGILRVEKVLGDLRSALFIFDREGDIFEAIETLQDVGARFVIRAAVDRRLEDSPLSYLFESVMAEPVRAQKEIVIPAGGGRKERKVLVSLRGGAYTVLPPKARNRSGESRRVNVVSIREEQPPLGEDPVEWVLLTSEPIETPDDLLDIMNHYCGRWKIEEWHKALKTGCRIEARQLEEWNRLDVLLGVFSVLAWRLLALRDAARQDPEGPVKDLLSPAQSRIIEKMNPSMGTHPGARDYLLAVAKLGGFLGRKRDGNPGWITLWRGLSRLNDIEVGFNLAHPAGDVGNG